MTGNRLRVNYFPLSLSVASRRFGGTRLAAGQAGSDTGGSAGGRV